MPDKKDNNTVPDEPVRPPVRRRKINGLWVLAAVFVIAYLINFRPDIETVTCTDETLASKPDVIMLGTWWCSYCAQARRFFHDENISYCEYDIERSETGKQMYQDINGRGIPVLLIGDTYQLSGFDKRSVERALQLVQQARQKDHPDDTDR